MSGEIFGMTLTPQFTKGDPQYNDDPTAVNPIGIKTRWKGNTYRYVQHHRGAGTVASAAKGSAHWKSLTPTTSPPVAQVSSDQSDAIYGVNGVAGFYLGIQTHLYYCWIQVGGRLQVTTVAGAVVGDQLTGSATDLTLARIASGSGLTDKLVAVVESGSTSGGPTVLLTGMDW